MATRLAQWVCSWVAMTVTGCSFDWSRYEDHHAGAQVTCATGVSDLRVARLARGIDLYGWLTEASSPSEFISDAELNEFARIGMTFVRASFFIHDPTQSELLNQANLGKFSEAIQRVRAANLGILFVPYFDATFKQKLVDPDSATRAQALDDLLRMWTQFAKFLAPTEPDWVFLELMGAPDFADSASWNEILLALAKRVRQEVPQHTIVADGNSGSLRVNWTSMTAMSTLTPIPDERNVIYGFIFFDPVIFTHQGADWRPEWPELSDVSNLPYPSSPSLVAPALAGITNQAARADAESYGRESFGPELLSLGLDKVATWSEQNCARVMCIEFGAYRAKAPADSVARWIDDVRTLFDTHRIGWSYWSYRERMGIAAPQPGPVVDLQIGTALGLRP
jgi:endoglucanase